MTIDNLRTQTFSDSLEMLSQQRMSKFRSYCRTDTATPGQKSHRMLSQIEALNVSERTNRAETIDNSAVNYDGRWVYWKRYHFDTIVDDIDLKQTNITPEGMIVQSAVASMNRQVDEDFVSAFFGTSQTGETGGTSTVFDTNNVVAVTVGASAATGLNVAKLRESKKILLENEVDVDFEQIFVGISPKQHDDLLALTQVVSTDFNDRPVLVDGVVRQFLGMNFIISNRLSQDGSSYRRNPVWAPSGMGCATWKEITGEIRELPNYKGKPDLIEAEMQLGFTRLEEAKCVEIKCSEA
jgi:hypothetical protein